MTSPQELEEIVDQADRLSALDRGDVLGAAAPRSRMLYLVRHAHADYSPDETRSLSEQGRKAAVRVADLLLDRDVSAIVSSPYRRAVETVQPLADRLGLPVQVDANLRERLLSTGPLDDFRRALEATWRDFNLTYQGGESSTAAQARVSTAIRAIAESSGGRNIVIGSHGNALALFLRTLDAHVDFAFWARMSMPDLYAVDVRDVWSYQRVWSEPT